jgi:hypothetical protein
MTYVCLNFHNLRCLRSTRRIRGGARDARRLGNNHSICTPGHSTQTHHCREIYSTEKDKIAYAEVH